VKHISIGEFLTEEEIAHVKTVWERTGDTSEFVEVVQREVIQPNMARINATLGQENDARYLAYAVAAVFVQLATGAMDPDIDAPAPPGRMWEWAEDRCQVCDLLIGHGLRFMHVGMCDACAKAPKH